MIKMKTKSASILVLTLWVLSLLILFLIGVGQNVKAHLNFASHMKKRVKNYYIAKAGVELGIAAISQEEDSPTENLQASWANDQDLFKEISLDGGYLSLTYSLDNAEGQQQVLYGVEDECSKININKIPLENIRILLERAADLDQEEAIDLAAAIKDWRDADKSVSLGGAEDQYYQGLEQPYQTSNSEFELIQELLFVRGVTAEIFSKIKEVITVYGQGKVNINTTDAFTLYALGLDKGFAQAIIQFRQGGDQEDGTGDDNVFDSVNSIREAKALFTEESAQLNQLVSKGLLTVNSNTFRINSLGKTVKSETGPKRLISCVVEKEEGQQPKIVYWHEK